MAEPVTQEELKRRLSSARAAVLERTQRLRRRRRSHRLLLGGSALLLAGSGLGATLVYQQVSAEEARTAVRCFQHDDLGSLTTDIRFAEGYDPKTRKTTPAATADVRESCDLAFRMGLAVAGAHGEHWPDVKDPNGLDGPSDAIYPVPPLAFCYLSNGMRAAFPIERPSQTAREVCDRLGLEEL